MAMQQRLLVATAALCVITGGCTGHADTAAPTGPAPHSAVPSPDPSAVPAVVDLPCGDTIDTVAGRQRGHQTVLGIVQLPTAAAGPALQAARQDGAPPRYFANAGLVIRSDTPAELLVVGPDDLDGALGWGNPARFGRSVRIGACAGSSGSGGWLVYAGGFETTRPGCLTIEVRTGGRSERVKIGVGTACPGQDPPPQPSDD